MGEILAETLVFIILNYIGGTIRWLVALFWSLIFNTKRHPYKAYIQSSDIFESFDDNGTGCLNIIIGLAFIIIVIMIIKAL